MKTLIQRLIVALAVACTFSIVDEAKAAATVVRISAGFNNSMFVKSDGSLWVMGYNYYGELGENPGTNYTVPVRIVPNNVSACDLSGTHSLFLKTDGSLWTMGRGNNGQLGDGKLQDRANPLAIMSSGVTRMATGSRHSLFKTSTGTRLTRTVALQGMGFNGDGQLGDGTTTQREFPVQIRTARTILNRLGEPDLNDILVFAAGDNHSLFVQEPNGGLWAMGNNISGQLGDGTTMNRLTPVSVASGAVAVAAGGSVSLFVKSDGSLWGMGQNNLGQLGDGTTTRRPAPIRIVASGVTSVATGGLHSLFIKSDGSLWAMGSNNDGQLGDGSLTQRQVPVRIAASNVVAVAAGSFHSLFIKSDGSLWGMGKNGLGELGDGTKSLRSTPVPIVLPQQPGFAGMHRNGSTFVLDARGQTARTYVTLMASDLNRPTAQWRTISTNQPNASGEFTITIPNGGLRHQFFALRLLEP